MSIRLLIADDHDLVADGLKSLVEATGDVQVVALASTGRESVQRALALKPDVVLMDMMMPEMNGIEATRAIRARLPDTQVIIISMHSSAEYVYRAIEAGAVGYLVKRAATRELFDAIHTVHSGRRFFSEHIAESVIQLYVSGQASRDPLSVLSPRERQVLQLLAEGNSVANIATTLSLSSKTVEGYRARLYAKLGIDDLASLVRFAMQQGVISLDCPPFL